ncbi:hypothetical protein DFQ27_003849 [Actinomortierella ambigua]|uniref:FAD-binding domain-containing protein n=1 Tax=Actinomortierella ambigua TaxID=1343610 RepID=A0A9P6UCE4_9FUNG|nr:hypothetical protein DFQ27_003849 [Actinomortierella ambigua]
MPPRNLKVIIVGGGIGGLALSIMFERAGIDYEVIERSSTLKTLGSTIGLNACVLRLLDQLGMYPDIERISKPIGGFHLQDEHLNPIGYIDFSFGKKHYGYCGRVMSRPALYEILKNKVPASKVHLSKQITAIRELKDGVECECSDGVVYRGDLLVGADGAYSQVRQVVQDILREQGKLAKGDTSPLRLRNHCVLGVTSQLDHLKFPTLDSEFSQFEIMLFRDKPISIWFSPVPGNKISWSYGGAIEKRTAELLSGDTSTYWEWGNTAINNILVDIEHLPTIYGATVGEIIGTTPKELISSVLLEEKLFSCWHSDRIVLLGDACHKVMPFAGQGAIHAMLDGVSLTNLLYNMSSTSTENIHSVFQTYYHERASSASMAVTGSRMLGLFFESKGLLARVVRYVSLNVLPRWTHRLLIDQMMYDRPQLSFLPPVSDRGLRPAYVYPYEKKQQQAHTRQSSTLHKLAWAVPVVAIAAWMFWQLLRV